MINTPVAAPDFHSLRIRGFLGFPANHSDRPIPLDGDIVMLTGPNGAGKSSLLEAIALRETGGSFRTPMSKLVHVGKDAEPGYSLHFDTDTVAIRSTKDGLPMEQCGWWQPLDADRQRHVRTVYFHPHYLGHLFEESSDSIGTSFIDLLAPAPRAVDDLRKSLKESLSIIERGISTLEKEAGYTSEETRAAERRACANELNTHVAILRARSPEAAKWLDGFSVERLVIRGGNLRKNWEGELANLARPLIDKISSQKDTSSISSLSLPAEALRAIAAAARFVAAHILSDSSSSNPLPSAQSSADLASALRALPETGWNALRAHVSGAQPDSISEDFERKRMAARRDEVRRLRNALGRGQDNFPDWMADFQRRSAHWRELIAQEKRPLIECPPDIANWLAQAGQLAEVWPRIAANWSEWSAQLEDQEKDLSYQLETIETIAQDRRQAHSLKQAIDTVLTIHPEWKGVLLNEKRSNDFITLLSTSSDSQEHEQSIPQAANQFAQVCDKWSRLERNYQTEDELLQSSVESHVGLQLQELRSLRDAVELESGTTVESRLGQLQQEALDGTLKPMEIFLNATANRFRIFNSILPIRLGRFAKNKSGARLALQVGTPPREVGSTSSGQRSQLGLLTFLALHFGLRSTYKGRVICLDEITSSFDLGQLPRLALLLRQIAYAPIDSPYRRRVFIASHNEEFTQRLAELLTPPAENSMRILRFTGYDAKTGPVIEPYLMHPAATFDPERLREYFIERYGQRNPAS